jgi:excisionase family DNA binding protein
MSEVAQPSEQRYYSVGQVAAILGLSSPTLYRAIHAGEFPAVRIRGRYIVPAKVLDLITEAALRGALTEVAPDWTPGGVA